MIILGANAVSELMRLAPVPAGLAWFTGHDTADLYLSAISEAEFYVSGCIAVRWAARRRRILPWLGLGECAINAKAKGDVPGFFKACS